MNIAEGSWALRRWNAPCLARNHSVSGSMSRLPAPPLIRALLPIFLAGFGILLGRSAWAEQPVVGVQASASLPPPQSAPVSTAPIATLLADPRSLVAWLTRMNPSVQAARARVAQADWMRAAPGKIPHGFGAEQPDRWSPQSAGTQVKRSSPRVRFCSPTRSTSRTSASPAAVRER